MAMIGMLDVDGIFFLALWAPLFMFAVVRAVEAMDASAPRILRPGPGNEASLVTLRDGTIKYYFTNMRKQRLLSIESADHGRTWSEPVVEFTTGHTHHGVHAIVNDHGDTHVFYLDKRYTGAESEEWAINKTLFIDVLHRRKSADGPWSPPHKIFQGYCGALLGGVQMDSGRIVLPLGRCSDRGGRGRRYHPCPRTPVTHVPEHP